MRKFLLEVCVDSVESALAAKKGGADRLELCGNLIIGGTTPSEALFKEIRKHTDIRTHILVRPRFGDFCYTDYELSIMEEEIKSYRRLGAEGVVIGVLRPDGTIDEENMKRLIEAAGDMSITLHRAFDVCRNPEEALKIAKKLGVNTILTSGQKNTCLEGTEMLHRLKLQAGEEIDLLAGSAVSAVTIPEIYRQTGITSFHMSGKKIVKSQMNYRSEEVNMGAMAVSEYEILRTDEEEIREARKILDQLEDENVFTGA